MNQNIYPLSTKESNITVLPENPANQNFFFLPMQGSFSFNEAIQFGKNLLSQTFSQSDLSIFLQEKDNYFLPILGPFPKKSDAEFVRKNLDPFQKTLDIFDIGQNNVSASFKIDNKLFLLSPIFPRNQISLAFKLMNRDDSIIFEKIDYPGCIQVFITKNQSLSVVNETDLETYLQGVVPSEMPEQWNLEALKAQSVVSRTFAMNRLISARKSGSYFDVTDDTSSQVYRGKCHSTATQNAINSTQGIVLLYNNQLIESVFHSTSGGFTESNDKIWGSIPYPYLRAAPSPGEEISPHFSWCIQYPMADFITKLNLWLSKEKKKPISTLSSLQILEKGESPRVRKVELITDIGSLILTGKNIQDAFSLKSTWMEFLITDQQDKQTILPLIDYFINTQSVRPNDQKNSIVYIYGRGWGHGVGMSQYGALAQARKGSLYQDILKSYYKNITLGMAEDIFQLQSMQNNMAACSLTFSPMESKIKMDQYQDLILQIKTSQPVFGISFDILYPKNLLSIPLEEIREGTFLKSDGKSIILQKAETGSEIKIVLAREGRTSGGVSGQGDLLLLKIRGRNKGTGKIEIGNLQVMDSQLNPIFSESNSCRIEVLEPDLIPPKTQITSFPDRFTNKKIVYFEWNGIDDQTKTQNLTYSYRMNDEPWSEYTMSTSQYFSIPIDGYYVFLVKSRDEAGNEDPYPPSYSFSVDLTPPKIEISDYPQRTYGKQITILGKCEPGITLLMNGQPINYEKEGHFSLSVDLSLGKNLIRLIGIDQASNATTIDIVIERILMKTVYISMTIGSSKALVNDQFVPLEVPPLIRDNRTLVPLRFIAEAFGANLIWTASNQQIEISLQTPTVNHKIVLWIGKKKSILDDKNYDLDTAPLTLPPGRTVVPIRFIAEAFESNVEWQSLTRSIKITFPKSKNTE